MGLWIPRSVMRTGAVRSRPAGRRLPRSGWVWVVLLLAFRAPCAVADDRSRVDQLLAAVNGKVVTGTDLELARQLNALLLFGREAGSTDRGAELERLIDLELLRGELAVFAVEADAPAVEASLQELRDGYAEIGGLPALLSKIGLQADELRDYLRLQVATHRFVRFRFRPFANPSDAEIGGYYRDKYVPQLQRLGVPVPPLPEVSAKIEELLREQQVNDAMEKWLLGVRSQARIEYFEPVDLPAGKGVRP